MTVDLTSYLFFIAVGGCGGAPAATPAFYNSILAAGDPFFALEF